MTFANNWKVRLAVVVIAAGALIAALYSFVFHPETEGRGTISSAHMPMLVLAEREARAQGAGNELAGVEVSGSRLLFGDLHVHTTFSTDAFAWSLPMVGGEGAHPPADACDFARFCSQLDFFALTDHAEALTPERWRESITSIRECNAIASHRPEQPELVAFVGFEWTQMGLVAEEHYGHRNVVFKGISDAELPVRPIAAGGTFAAALQGPGIDYRQMLVPLRRFKDRERYLNWALFREQVASVRACPRGVDVHDLPADCREYADTPQELFEKLAQWDVPVLAIPHGTTWGSYTPLGSNWKKQLTPQMTDPTRQRLFEVYSGHGNSEELSSFREVMRDERGELACPPEQPNYEPCCHRAGELVRRRCGDISAGECEARVKQAELDYVTAGAIGHHTLPGTTADEWGDCGQCRDCFLPAFNYRPGGSAQFVLAARDFTNPKAPEGQTFGFVASSDNHRARPGTGYKQYARRAMTEASGPVDEEAMWTMHIEPGKGAPARSVNVDPKTATFPNGFARMEFERMGAYFLTGGLVAVHVDSKKRARDRIWDALFDRSVYATSGPRIELWFSAQAPDVAETPMGRELTTTQTPTFRVRARGSREQKPGCSSWVEQALGPERLERLCRGECYNPTSVSRPITRIEVVRIRPQIKDDEPVPSLVEDPWLTLPCPADKPLCEVTFEDAEYAALGRDVTYYVRAIEAPSQRVNGGLLRCEYDAQGRCVKTHPCYADMRTDANDDCLAPVEERAWSSPIYLRRPKSEGGAP